jgi:probable F420-dependent oxidoreductase
MRVGIEIGRVQSETADQARWAEDAGFDQVATGEHLFFHVPTPNTFIGLAAAAGATRTIRLLSSLTLIPQYPPALLAKLVASLDQVSNGRLDFGVGVGGEYPKEYVAAGVDVRQRGARADEALEVLSALLTGEEVTHSGRFVELPGVRLQPTSVQRPGPPVWVGGRKPASTRRAGRFGDVWMPYMATPEQLAKGLAEANAAAVAAGRPDGSVRGAIFAWAAVAADSAHARQRAIDVVGEVYQQDFTSMVDRYLVAGDPDTVLERLRQYHAAGAEHVIISTAAGSAAERLEMATLFASEVVPVVRTW